MIFLILGPSHSGKTLLAHKLMCNAHVTYLSLDLLKMGLIRSSGADVSVLDDTKIGELLWPVAVEIIKTAVENRQDLIVEGVYIPYDFKQYFTPFEQEQIQECCLVMSKEYIISHAGDIRAHENAIEWRKVKGVNFNKLIVDNEEALKACRSLGLDYVVSHDGFALEDALMFLTACASGKLKSA